MVWVRNGLGNFRSFFLVLVRLFIPSLFTDPLAVTNVNPSLINSVANLRFYFHVHTHTHTHTQE